MISGPYYINLDHRTDRKELIKQEFYRLGLTGTRFPAISNTDGALGCMDSHALALRSFPEPPPIQDTEEEVVIDMDAGPKPLATWVCEDDVQFLVNRQTLDLYIREFMESDADILCLGYASRKDQPYSQNLLRSFDLQTTSCYIVKNSFKDQLQLFWSTVSVCKRNNIEHPLICDYNKLDVNKGDFWSADQCWKLLQQSHVFVIPAIRCVIQRAGYSDIEKKFVNYGI